MKTIYIDVTNYLNFPHLTGIQRVLAELAVRLIANPTNRAYQVVLLQNTRDFHFCVCDNARFFANYVFAEGKKADCLTKQELSVDQLAPGAFWLDLDAVWAATVPRRLLYPQLAKRNLQIGVYVYDVIVLTHPQYCSQENCIRYPAYLAAVFDYADFIFTEAASTCEQIQRLAEACGCARAISYRIAAPGANSFRGRADAADVAEEVQQIVARGKILLTVSTLEARKNHAVLLDAFDAGLAEMGYQMVFVGRCGWKIDALLERLRNHPEYGRTLHHLQGVRDDALQVLYQHADFVLFPSYIEGYGLAAVEALQNGVPAILSDVPIMREVGGAFCDYFPPDSPQELVARVRFYETHPEAYAARREALKAYRAPSWDACAEAVLDPVLAERDALPEHSAIRQIVYLSARADSLRQTLAYVEAYMPFIREAVVLCPDATAEEMRATYRGALRMTYLTDGTLLQGRRLPRDHARRNFLLRCLAMHRPEIEEEFIMSDDDYRPLEPMDETFFVAGGRYQAFYFYDLDQWSSNVQTPTSYDQQMIRTNLFLKENRYPNLQYAAHMPQVIRKEWYLDLLRAHPGLEQSGCDEWSTYFNYAVKQHPAAFDVRPYETLSWPETISAWDLTVVPPKFSFENFYDFLYDEGERFSGMHTAYQEQTYFENAQKRILCRAALARALETRRQWRDFENRCNTHWGQFPSLVLYYGAGEDPALVNPPPYLEMRRGSAYTLPVMLMKQDASGKWAFSRDPVKIGFCWDGSENFHIAENIDLSGRANIRVLTPEVLNLAIIDIYYALEEEKFCLCCQLPVHLKV